MLVCHGCGCSLDRQKRFCSNDCQRAAERRTRIDRWLSTCESTYVGARKEHYIRQHLMEEQRSCCDVCGCSDVWLGAPLTFVLDHLDGDSTNNRRENLRLVCPNCDSQLPTFKSRNRGKGRAWRRQRYAQGKSY